MQEVCDFEGEGGAWRFLYLVSSFGISEPVTWLTCSAIARNADRTSRINPFSPWKDLSEREVQALKHRAEQDDLEAWYELAVYYHQQKMPEDEAKWIGTLTESARQGDARAQHLLSLYYRRIGNPEAFSSLRSCAASGGYPNAQYSLGHFYRHGLDGVPVDKVQAYKWYKLAIEGGFGRFQLASLVGEITPEQIAEAERLVAEWRPGPGSCDAAASAGSP